MPFFTTGSLRKNADRQLAAQLICQGQVVGVFNRGVCALWFDGSNKTALKKVSKIKGEARAKKAVALTLSLEEFIPMIDTAQLSEPVRRFLSSADLKHQIGSLVFIRAPLKAHYLSSIPECAKTFDKNQGICMIQNWDSFGHSAVMKFLKTVRNFGVSYPAVTSMNKSGQPEIVEQSEAEDFCRINRVPLFLKDLKAHPRHKGSYTIISLEKTGVKLSRDGNIPGWLIELILGFPLMLENTKQPNYPRLDFPRQLLQNLPPRQIRQHVLQYLQNS